MLAMPLTSNRAAADTAGLLVVALAAGPGGGGPACADPPARGAAALPQFGAATGGVPVTSACVYPILCVTLCVCDYPGRRLPCC